VELEMDNITLYETSEVIGKYAKNTTRATYLNIPEKNIVDRFLLEPQKILEVGCGTGRVAANLYLLGHDVKGVDLSVGMVKTARTKFPQARFPKLLFENDDAITLAKQKDASFDTVFFTMNTIDYLKTLDDRKAAIISSNRVLKDNGLLILSSHNHKAYVFSYKDLKTNSPQKRAQFLLSGQFAQDTIREEEPVLGGGTIWKSTPEYVISQTEDLGFKFIGFAVDARSRLDHKMSRSMKLSKYVFDYFVYVFRKTDTHPDNNTESIPE
jgi:ubiquinone/menaquinone biosynthesis C-methylase UbiE